MEHKIIGKAHKELCTHRGRYPMPHIAECIPDLRRIWINHVPTLSKPNERSQIWAYVCQRCGKRLYN